MASDKPIKEQVSASDRTMCKATAQMLEKARRDGVLIDLDRGYEMKPCPIGVESACCKHCFMGPCRLNPRDPYKKVGVCGATIDTIMARNFARNVATGSASHNDHGMHILKLFKDIVDGKNKEFSIKDTIKLERVATSIGIEVEGKEVYAVAKELCDELDKTFTNVDGEMPFTRRAPKATLEQWRKDGIVPRGAMREVMELMSRTHIGCDQEYNNLTKQISRTALADGWGGSMVATELSDIMFGTPSPTVAEVNMGVLKEDHVNVIVHGHEPAMFEGMLAAVSDPFFIDAAKAKGAKGINLIGMCCSGAEMMSRHGVPHAGNFGSTEAIMVTGAVDAMVVDIQCIKQGLAAVAKCYDTHLITTNARAHIEGATHIEFDDHDPRACTDQILTKAITRFGSRSMPIEIPQQTQKGVHGFTHEYIEYMLGGTFRGSYSPLNDNIINGRIRGVAGVVGCTNPKVKQDSVHVALVQELIKNDVLVLQTGCSQIALAKAGFLTPEAAPLAGPGLAEVCETVGMPPVLGLGSCVDNTRILIAASAMVKAGGLGNSIADLPVAGCAPEWMSEKALAIGQYFVASGVYTVFGIGFPSIKGTKFHDLLFNGLEQQGYGKWGVAVDPIEIAHMMIAHIDKKRKELGIDKTRERTLVDMSDRRDIA
ncbi:MAG: anaerobic carbon-monoxide dehydrogenase catalytic subunit [Proteobacteria bacterium]|nr:anaerobic carbon-monoxide dehydrogenase catalytic subunit [Desulfobacula sp.]MBU3952043.1 anaerobic carbon-monoxide dehydrogenase catalytic subunit [Pseudomonadota bacterium]MBU4129666.1 anaerobic carbon-monoxide dehydrogenase catalytic subunit [Pseudomonadota bacterium]